MTVQEAEFREITVFLKEKDKKEKTTKKPPQDVEQKEHKSFGKSQPSTSLEFWHYSFHQHRRQAASLARMKHAGALHGHVHLFKFSKTSCLSKFKKQQYELSEYLLPPGILVPPHLTVIPQCTVPQPQEVLKALVHVSQHFGVKEKAKGSSCTA